MGRYEYGIYVSVWTWVLILGTAHAGLNTAVIRLMPEYRENGQIDQLRGLTRGSRIAALGLSTVVMVAGLAGVYLLKSHIENHFVLPALFGPCLHSTVLIDRKCKMELVAPTAGWKCGVDPHLTFCVRCSCLRPCRRFMLMDCR